MLREMADFLAEKLEGIATVELLPTVENSEICIADMRKASCDDDCIGVITWMLHSHRQKCGQRSAGVEKAVASSSYSGE